MKKNTLAIIDQDQEKQLVDKLISHDELAYETLVRYYSGKMYAVARRFFSEDDDAQEALQKAFIQVFKNISAFKKGSSLMTWLHRITVNEALMIIRQKKRQKTLSLESYASYSQHYNKHGERTVFSDDSGRSLIEGLGHNIEALFEKQELKLSLRELIFQLPEKYCNVLLLRDIQEINTKETANILGLSEVSVKTQLHRARLLLKSILEQQNKARFENNWEVS